MRKPRTRSTISNRSGGSPQVSFPRMILRIVADSVEAILGGPLVTIGLFIFAWTVYPDVHWIAPIIGSGVFGAG